MNAEILEQLSRITPEEQKLRDGEPLDRTLYATGHGFEIEAAKLLRQGQLITIRVQGTLRISLAAARRCVCRPVNCCF